MTHPAEVLEVLKSTPLLRGVARDLLDKNLSSSVLHRLKAGEVLLKPGQDNDFIYIILSGRLNIQNRVSDVAPFAVFGAGECVGEMSVLGGAPVSTYVLAATDCQLIAIGHVALWELIDSSHAAAHNMLNILSERIRHTNQIINASFLTTQEFPSNSSVDELTGLYTWHWMQYKLNRWAYRDGVDQKTSCLMMLEIDFLKQFNAKYGQIGGEQALQDIARTMMSCLRPGDLLGRHIGEQFIAFLPDTSLPEASIAAERLRAVVNESMIVLSSGDALPAISISLGISQSLPDDSVDLLLARTSHALLTAKDSGGNCVKLVS